MTIFKFFNDKKRYAPNKEGLKVQKEGQLGLLPLNSNWRCERNPLRSMMYNDNVVSTYVNRRRTL